MIKKLVTWTVAALAAVGIGLAGQTFTTPTTHADGTTWQYTSGSHTNPSPNGTSWQ